MKTISNGQPSKAEKSKRFSSWWLVLPLAGVIFSIRPLLPRIVFMPSRDIVITPMACDMPFDDVTIAASDGVNINGWYVPAPEARGTLLFFHGNAGNISHRLDSIDIFLRLAVCRISEV